MDAELHRSKRRYVVAAAVASFVAQPVPALDELIVIPIHYSLVRRIARGHRVALGSLPWTQIRRIIWYGAGARLVGNFSLGLLPVAGMFSNALTAIALTEFLAEYLEEAVEHPDREPPQVDMATLKRMFDAALARYRGGEVAHTDGAS
jgi:uncharacterized protein (DUF697 family)